jgi:hypothetical protein
MSSAIVRTEQVDGWTLGFASQGDEPRVRDLDLAARLGFSRSRTIRDLIERLVRDGKLSNVEVCRTVQQTSGGRPGREFWLTEAQALKVVAKSETDKADAILDEVIAVYLAWRRGHLAPTVAPTDIINALAANNLRVGDNPSVSADLKSKIGLFARSARISFQRAHGRLKRDFRVASYRYLSLVHYPLAREQLLALAERPDMPPALAASAATKQLDLFAALAKGAA